MVLGTEDATIFFIKSLTLRDIFKGYDGRLTTINWLMLKLYRTIKMFICFLNWMSLSEAF